MEKLDSLSLDINIAIDHLKAARG